MTLGAMKGLELGTRRLIFRVRGLHLVRALGGIPVDEAALVALHEAKWRMLREGQPVSEVFDRSAGLDAALVKSPQLFDLAFDLFVIGDERRYRMAADDAVRGFVRGTSHSSRESRDNARPVILSEAKDLL